MGIESLSLPAYYERVLFMGENGGGKTYLAERMLAHYDRFVAIDLKGDLSPPCKYTIIREPDDWRWNFMRPDRIVYRPKPEYKSGPWLNYMMRRLWDRSVKEGKKHPYIIYVDEGLMTAKMGSTLWLENLIVGARGLMTGVWLSSQRPRHIPVEMRSEAWRWYVFALGYLDDEVEVVKYSKGKLKPEQLQSLDGDYSFYEIRRIKGGRKEVKYFPPLIVAPATKEG